MKHLIIVGLLLFFCSVQAQVIKVACVGDSITEGGMYNDPAVTAYPVVLGRLLGTNYQVRNFGVSGTTMLKKGDYPYWKASAFKTATNSAPNVVTIMLGTNDSRYNNWQYKNQFADDLRALIDAFANLPSHPKVILCLPVPAYAFQYDINPEVIRNEIIRIIKQVGKDKNVPVVDLYTPLSGRPELFPDQIHPLLAGESIIAKYLHAAILSL